MAFIIDKDHLAAEDSILGSEYDCTGMVSAAFESDVIILRNDKNVGRKFRMYDDDGILYYSGRYLENPEENSDWIEWDEFQPLDSFGTPNAGAVRIDYYDSDTKTWETL